MNNGNNPAMFKFMPITEPLVTVNARSPSGCWTCRIRRKKCDEFKPACKSCSDRNIDCHWGPKPDWMDGGKEEKKRVEEIKEEVNKNSIRRRLMTRGGLISSSLSSKQSTASTNSSRSQASSPFASASSFAHSPGSTTSDLSSTPSSVSVNNSHIEGHRSVYSLPISTNDRCSSSRSLKIEPTQVEFGQDFRDNLFYHLERYGQQAPPPVRRSENGCDLVYCHTRNANALSSRYFQHIFPRQFSLPLTLQSASHGLQNWLPHLIMRSASLYHLSLCLTLFETQLSQCHTSNCPSESEFSMEFSRNHSLGLEQMRVILEAQHRNQNTDVQLPLDASVEVLLDILFLVALERYRGGVDWKIHLDAALTLLPTLRNTTLSRNSSKELKTEMSTLRSAEEFVLGFLISLDILLCTSDLYTTRLKCTHEEVLRISNVELSEIVGCDGWVMVGIARINGLRQWKAVMQNSQMLSIPELVRQANEIEELLQSRLKFIEERKTQSRYAIISKIYIHSALTYLHVVVSGVLPELREVRKTVGQTLLHLQELSSQHTAQNVSDQFIFQNLIWPLLITGCMASKSQQSLFLEIVEENRKHVKEETGTFRNVLQVVDACWDAREKGEKDCDWSFAMKKLGISILFL